MVRRSNHKRCRVSAKRDYGDRLHSWYIEPSTAHCSTSMQGGVTEVGQLPLPQRFRKRWN